MKFIFFITITLLCFIGDLSAQNRNTLRAKPFANNDIFFANIIALPTVSQDSLSITLCYSILYDGLVFQKADNNFFATPEIEVIFKDNDGITRKRFISNDTVFVNTFQQTQAKNKYYTNFAQFVLAKTNYKIISKLNNSKSLGNFPIETSIENTHVCYAPLFLQPNSSKQDVFLPSMLNDCISFAVPNVAVFIPMLQIKAEDKFSFTIRKQTENPLYDWGNFSDITGECNIANYIFFRPTIGQTDMQLQKVNSNSSSSFLTFDLSMETFSPGNYTLTITNSDIANTSTNINFNFEVRWFNMPISISNPEFAIEQMYLILTDGEFSAMESSNNKELFSKILDYWKKNDPTPSTQYNEAMAEFFHRVDYVEEKFRTLTQREGAKSDRGKVFILNGPADKITSETKEKSNFEIWYYNKSKAKYIFEVVSVGNYKLVNISNE